jgi:spore maturation protein CgeB
MRKESLVIVGIPEAAHVGAHLHEAASTLPIDVTLLDSRLAYEGPRWLRSINWWMLGRRPIHLRQFSARVLEVCLRTCPRVLLTTGLAPLDCEALEALGKLGVKRCNYLTDDPWNPAHRASWFMKALPFYDHVFSTRKANLDDLRRHGCRSVWYLPFAYSPSIHHPAEAEGHKNGDAHGADLIFAGGADPDRVPYLSACIEAGFRVQLYGGYWERYADTRKHASGFAHPHKLREDMSRAKVSLCLVRRANRDGHVMRSFELPAIGVCMLTEETEEHKSLFGDDGENVIYFRTPKEAVDRLRWLLAHDAERAQLAANAHRLIVQGQHTYRHRLKAMLELASETAALSLGAKQR